MRGLKGKTVILTGAGGGIGQALAVRFAEEGCRLALPAREDLRVLGHTRAVVVFDFVVDGLHWFSPRGLFLSPLPACREREKISSA